MRKTKIPKLKKGFEFKIFKTRTEYKTLIIIITDKGKYVCPWWEDVESTFIPKPDAKYFVLDEKGEYIYE